MKTIILFLFLLLLLIPLNNLYSQDTFCKTPYASSVPLSLGKGSAYEDLSTVDWVDVGLGIHIIRQTNGTGGLDPNLVSSIVSNLNAAYSGAKIRFFVHTQDLVNNDYYYVGNFDSAKEDQLAAQYNVSNVINIYFVPNYDAYGRATFTSDIGQALGDDRREQSVIVRNDAASGSTTPHEVGHYLNLFHTWEAINTSECPDGCNSSTAGDLVIDTPAEPKDPQRTNFNNNCQFTKNDATVFCACTKTSQYYNVNALNSINAHNFMSYAPISCRYRFTTEQLSRARTQLDTKRAAELLKKWVQFSNIITQ